MNPPDAPSSPTPLSDLVATASAVAATRSRTAKWAALGALLGRLQPGEVEIAVGYLAGEPRQGRIGVGWATLAEVAPAAAAARAGEGASPGPPLTVLELDATLDALQATTGPGSQERRQTLLAERFARASAEEADFVVRLLQGGLRQGALAGVVAEAVARAAGVPPELLRRAHMLSGNLGHTAALAMAGGAEALGRVGLEVGRPLEPMLASSAETLQEALAELAGAAQVEWKLDGIRLQVHRRGDEVRLYTRNLNDITGRLPELVDLVRGLPASAFVLDGEALTLGEDERPRLFQQTMSQLGLSVPAAPGPGSGAAVGVWFFDLLHLEGQDLIDEPLSRRSEALEGLVGRLRIPALRVEGREPADLERAVEFQRAALEAGHEGVLVKSLASTYQAGRRGAAWIKVKPTRTLDLVVLGAEWGHGRRQGWLSNLHLGARDPASGGFVMVGKTFKGLTDAALREQTEALLALETGRRGIVVEVRPERVLEIELDGVQVSTRYPGGVALRFARVKGIRRDKRPDEADTLETVRSLLGTGS